MDLCIPRDIANPKGGLWRSLFSLCMSLNCPFLCTDALMKGFGMDLNQVGKDKHALTFNSRTLLLAED